MLDNVAWSYFACFEQTQSLKGNQLALRKQQATPVCILPCKRLNGGGDRGNRRYEKVRL